MSLIERLRAAASRPPQDNEVHAQIARLGSAFPESPVTPPDFSADTLTDAEACLRPLLGALGWLGSERLVKDALPHFEPLREIEGLRAVLARLGYESRPVGCRLCDLKEPMVPCLFVDEEGEISAVLAIEDGELEMFHGPSRQIRRMSGNAVPGVAYPVVPVEVEALRNEVTRSGWLRVVISRFRPLIWTTFLISALINLATLALPLFVMKVYDLGIGTRAIDVVGWLALGAALIIVTELALRGARTRAIAYFGARFDAILAMSAFQQLLHLPVGMTENAPIGTQVSRLKQFEGIRDIFTGTLATAIIDIPFILIFLVVIAFVGGPVVLVPLALLVLYACAAAVTVPLTRLAVGRLSEARQKHQDLVIETLSRRRGITDLGVEDVWLARHRRLAEDYAYASYRCQQLALTVQTVAQALMSIAGAATLGLGALWVINGTMTPGALIAVMALVWRVLTPLQQTFLSLPRLEQAIQSFRQIDRLMRLKLEREPLQVPSFSRRFSGNVAVARLQFRYPTRTDPVLRGVTFAVKRGEIVAITGRSGAGKTTLLRMMLGLYTPQGGAIVVDGLDLRQVDPAEWRGAVAYTPEAPIFFYGTVAQNLRFGHPVATTEDLRRACREAGIREDDPLLPEGLDTRLTGTLLGRLPEALKQRLNLARAWVKDAPLHLLDNPGNNLDQAGDAALMAKLESLRGRSTVIMTTFRPSHMRLADRLLVIEDGQIALDGPPEVVLARMPSAA